VSVPTAVRQKGYTLIVIGGGGGGAGGLSGTYGQGGRAGGVSINNGVTASSVSITIGSGGAGGACGADQAGFSGGTTYAGGYSASGGAGGYTDTGWYPAIAGQSTGYGTIGKGGTGKDFCYDITDGNSGGVIFQVTMAAPSAPTIGTISADATLNITVPFTAVNAFPAVTSYEASCSGTGATTVTGTATSSPVTVANATPGKNYTCTVRATNGSWSPASSASNSILVPGAPWNNGGADLPSFTGTAAYKTDVAEVLTGSDGNWNTPSGYAILSYTYLWQSQTGCAGGWSDAPGSTKAMKDYTVVAADLGNCLRLTVAATNFFGTSSAVASTTSLKVTARPVFTAESPVENTPLSQLFTYTFVATGNLITYSLVDSNLPGTITINASTGVLSGTPTVAGSYSYSVQATNTAGSLTTAVKTLHVGRSATLSTGSTTQASGVQFSISPTVTLATGATPGTSVSVTASVVDPVSGSHTLGGTLTQSTNLLGVATWNDLVLTGTAGSYTIRFSASGWPSADLTVTLGAGPAAALAVTTQPVGGVLAGATLGTVPVVRVIDSVGNTVTSSSAVITAAIASGSVNATLSAASATASSGVATFSGMKVNLAGGNYTVTFSSPGLTSVTSNTFTINRTSQTITFSYTGGSKTYTSADFRVTASTTSQLPVTFSSGTPTVCGVSGDADDIAGVTGAVVSVLGVGTCTIHADQAGDDLYSAATRQSVNITVSQAAQAALSLANSTSVDFGETLTLSTTGGSGTGGVTYALIGGAGTASCSINSSTNTLTFGAAGTCSVQATKAADTNYTVQTTSSTLITVNRAAQTVNFTSQVPANPLPGGTYTVSASTSSGLAPTLSILVGLGTVCSMSGSSSPATVTFLTSGDCVLMASQFGNGNYLPVAIEAEQPIKIGSLNQSITFAALDDRDFGDPSEALSVSASSSLTVTLTNDTPTVCSLTGRTVAIITIGRCTITASQAGNAVYSAAGSVTRSFEINAVVANSPTITSVSAQSGAVAIGFAAPAFTGGVAILGYHMVAYPTSGGASVTSDECTTSPCVFEGLTNGTEYTIKLATRNSVGIGPESAASPAVTPATAALAVRDAQASIGDASLTVSWEAPDDFGGGAFMKYELRLRVAGASWPSASSFDVLNAASGTHTFTSLTNGTSYEIQIVTITTANAASITGNTALIVAVPMTVPSAPRLLTAGTHSPREALISWSEPSNNGGSSVTSYTVTLNNGATCGTVTIDSTTRSASCRVSSLALGTTYTVTVHANNLMGAGATATANHTTATFTGPSTGPTGTPPCANCFDDPNDPNDTPVNPTPVKTPPTTKPGSISLSDGVATVTVTSAVGTSSVVDSSGRLVISSTGSALISGSAVLATTTAKSWIAGAAWGTATVTDQGTFTMTVAIPADTKTGEVAVAVDVVNENGASRRFSFTLYVVASVPSSGPTATPACSNCYDDPNDPNDKPTSPTPTKTPPTTRPGSISLTDGVATVTVTSADGTTSVVDSSGRLVISSTGSALISGSGAFAKTTAKSWFATTAWGTSTVADAGTFTMTVAIPTDTKTGEVSVAVDVVNENGAFRRFNFMLLVVVSVPSSGPTATPACSNCYDDPNDSNDKPVSPTPVKTPPTTKPGSISLSDGVATVTVTSPEGTSSNIDASGRLVIASTGSALITGSGLFAKSTANSWFATTAWGTANVAAAGTFTMTLAIPTDTKTGPASVAVDVVNENGAFRRFNFTLYVIASAPTTLTGEGWTGGGKTPSTDPKKPCSGCVSVFPDDPSTDKKPTVTSSPAGTSPAQVSITTGKGTTAKIGGSAGTNSATSEIPTEGGFRVRPPGTIPIALGGLQPGSTVTVWIGDEFSVQGTVGADGKIELSAAIPSSLKPGLHALRIDSTEADGSAATMLLGIEIMAANDVLDVEATESGDKESKSKSGVRALSPLGSKAQAGSTSAATGIDISGTLLVVLLLEIVGIFGLAVARLRKSTSRLRL
jgi:hypothetical protein